MEVCRDKNCIIHKNTNGIFWNDYYNQWEEKEQSKMTKEDALKIIRNAYPIDAEGLLKTFIDLAERFKVNIKFDEPAKVNPLFEITKRGRAALGHSMDKSELDEFNSKYGIIRLEEWPEGLVLWVGGEIKFKSWEKFISCSNVKIGDSVIISLDYPIADCVPQVYKGILKDIRKSDS